MTVEPGTVPVEFLSNLIVTCTDVTHIRAVRTSGDPGSCSFRARHYSFSLLTLRWGNAQLSSDLKVQMLTQQCNVHLVIRQIKLPTSI